MGKLRVCTLAPRRRRGIAMPASKLNTGALAALIVDVSPVCGFLAFRAVHDAVFFRLSGVRPSLRSKPALPVSS